VTAIFRPIDAAHRLLAAFDPPATLLVAISGGSDSTGLLVLLAEALKSRRYPGLSLIAATVDHRLRPASTDEAGEVADLCRRLDIQHVIRSWDGAKPLHGIAAAARDARYTLLSEIADTVGAAAILTGHTADDQAETIAMRASRRSDVGNIGLAGMADLVLLHCRHWLVRPFLACRRADIRLALQAVGIGWSDDPSNIDLAYERPRIRATLAAELSAPMDASVFGMRRQQLSEAAADLFRQAGRIERQVLATFDRRLLSADPQALSYLLARLISVLGGRPHAPGHDSLNRILSFLNEGQPGRMTAGRVILDLRRDGLFLMRESRDLPALLVAAGSAAVWDGRFTVSNNGPNPVQIAPNAAGAGVEDLFPGVPSGVARRAMQAMPQITILSPQGHDLQQVTPRITPVPMLAGYDRFLPRFDLKLAGVLAAAFGHPLALPPSHRLLTEKTS